MKLCIHYAALSCGKSPCGTCKLPPTVKGGRLTASNSSNIAATATAGGKHPSARVPGGQQQQEHWQHYNYWQQ